MQIDMEHLRTLGDPVWPAVFRHFGAKAHADTLGASVEQFEAHEVTTPLRLAHWFGQFAHESRGFTAFEENLNYSAKRLCQVWPGRFPTLAAAEHYAGNPEALANKVYGFRMGNTAPGDGWKYRGRGPQITGRENYTKAAQRTGLDLVNNPDLAADPANFVLLACDYWLHARCNPAADDDNLVLVTKRVNGGTTGIAERRALVERGKKIFREAPVAPVKAPPAVETPQPVSNSQIAEPAPLGCLAGLLGMFR